MKAKEIREKAQALIPGSVQGLLESEKKRTQESGQGTEKGREDMGD